MTVNGPASGHSGKTIMIDNYDSFTWNVYGVLAQLGADVEVFRNDAISIEAIEALKPRNIVISPGPGHPRDAGISMKVIAHFAGKVPILGVCLGEQCMFELYGGTVGYAGEIVHGKTSPVRHDGKGLYKGVSQGIEVTRYHSLAGDKSTLPDCLEITSTTPSGVVMGVRHKDFVMEGVQYHPESIASEEGHRLIANFLSWEGGYWEQLVEKPVYFKTPKNERKRNVGSGIEISKISKLNSTGTTAEQEPTIPAQKKSILETIKDRRLQDVAQTSSQPGRSIAHLLAALAQGLAPAQIDFRARLRATKPHVAVLAEIKRASPSKGNIAIDADAAVQAHAYAAAGAAAISVLTEPNWFKGDLEDLKLARKAVEVFGEEERPAILRKEFIVDEYQIYEARLAGADTVLLIVAILLEDGILKRFIDVSRSLGMEPLVEVANTKEMQIAVDHGAKVIGVNNRDLHTFTVDMSRTSSLASMVPEDTILIALSGITGRADVEKYLDSGATGVLVGEHLMRSPDKRVFIRDLMGLPTPMDVTTPNSSANHASADSPLVKICAVTSIPDAKAAAASGANLIGLIFAPSPRQVTSTTAKSIIDALVPADRPRLAKPRAEAHLPPSAQTWYTRAQAHLRSYVGAHAGTPLFVGVFSNTPFEEVNRIVRATGIDVVQLHGDEDPRLVAPLICVPVVKAFHVHAGDDVASVLRDVDRGTGVLLAALLDTGVKGLQQQGGSGAQFDWGLASDVVKAGVPIWVAGGLDPTNVGEAVKRIGPAAVDVASGVEGAVKGVKDHGKVEAFVKGARQG
ncbi:indole-3-glycerol phosphate synthase-domain-containing protein [Chytriomyces sp. MP71]|nr:indole-3-glycerol phosphate synthase-domain-containing protein [Chytriomyces sp. MP71]